MDDATRDRLLEAARSVLAPRRLSQTVEVGGVGAALLTPSGNIYKGVCIDTASSLGFCAEHAAAGAMVTAGESRIVAMVAVERDGSVVPPCGRCRELVVQLDAANSETQVILPG